MGGTLPDSMLTTAQTVVGGLLSPTGGSSLPEWFHGWHLAAHGDAKTGPECACVCVCVCV